MRKESAMEERKKRKKMREILVEWVSRVSVLFTKDGKKVERKVERVGQTCAPCFGGSVRR